MKSHEQFAVDKNCLRIHLTPPDCEYTLPLRLVLCYSGLVPASGDCKPTIKSEIPTCLKIWSCVMNSVTIAVSVERMCSSGCHKLLVNDQWLSVVGAISAKLMLTSSAGKDIESRVTYFNIHRCPVTRKSHLCIFKIIWLSSNRSQYIFWLYLVD